MNVEDFVLTDDNYFSREADQLFMSVSQLKCWLKCEWLWAGKYARGEAKEQPSPALSLGTFFHTLLLEPEKVDAVLEEHAAMLLTKSGKDGADTARLREIATFIHQRPELTCALVGEREKIFTAEIDGVRWKIKVDVWNPDGFPPGTPGVPDAYIGLPYFLDLKTCADLLAEQYVPRTGTRGNFISQRDYWLQISMYRQIIAQNVGAFPMGLIMGCGKPTAQLVVPNIGIFPMIDERTLEQARFEATGFISEIRDAVMGRRGLRKCQQCDWCRSTRTNFWFEIGGEETHEFRGQGRGWEKKPL